MPSPDICGRFGASPSTDQKHDAYSIPPAFRSRWMVKAHSKLHLFVQLFTNNARSCAPETLQQIGLIYNGELESASDVEGRKTTEFRIGLVALPMTPQSDVGSWILNCILWILNCIL
jgi:hypothetical protein